MYGIINHERLAIGMVVENRGGTVLICELFEEIKNGEPGFDGVQFEHGAYRSRWAYSEDTTAIVALPGSDAAVEFARSAARYLRDEPETFSHEMMVDLLGKAYPDVLDILD